ncbi:MAG: hypothetical protein AAF975_04190, partial [Spirochaetota bacterium]
MQLIRTKGLCGKLGNLRAFFRAQSFEICIEKTLLLRIHYLIAPATMPLMTCFCTSKKNIMIGTA